MAETLKIVSTFDSEFYYDIFQKWISRLRYNVCFCGRRLILVKGIVYRFNVSGRHVMTNKVNGAC